MNGFSNTQVIACKTTRKRISIMKEQGNSEAYCESYFYAQVGRLIGLKTISKITSRIFNN